MINVKISQHDLVVGSVSNKQLSLSSLSFSPCRMFVIKSIGRGNMTVEFFSADIEFKVWNQKTILEPNIHTKHYTTTPCTRSSSLVTINYDHLRQKKLCQVQHVSLVVSSCELWVALVNTPSPLPPTCKYLSWRAEEDLAITSEASLRARLAFCSPSAAMTYNNNIAQWTNKNIISKMISRLVF